MIKCYLEFIDEVDRKCEVSLNIYNSLKQYLVIEIICELLFLQWIDWRWILKW